jgi:hypothetical protein
MVSNGLPGRARCPTAGRSGMARATEPAGILERRAIPNSPLWPKFGLPPPHSAQFRPAAQGVRTSRTVLHRGDRAEGLVPPWPPPVRLTGVPLEMPSESQPIDSVLADPARGGAWLLAGPELAQWVLPCWDSDQD